MPAVFHNNIKALLPPSLSPPKKAISKLAKPPHQGVHGRKRSKDQLQRPAGVPHEAERQ